MSFKLKPYQVAPVTFLLNHPRGIVVMRPGRGKTAVALGAIKLLMMKGKATSAVIFTHKRGVAAYRALTADLPMVYAEKAADLHTLSDEFEEDPNRVFVISTGLIARYEEEWNPKYTTTNEIDDPLDPKEDAEPPEEGPEEDGEVHQFPRSSSNNTSTHNSPNPHPCSNSLSKSILNRILNFSKITVIDEIHNYRNYKLVSSEGLSLLLRPYRLRSGVRLWAMTATPFYTKMDDIFQIMSLVEPNLLGTFAAYQALYYEITSRPSQVYKWVSGPAGRRKILIPTTIPEVTGYKNEDALQSRLAAYIYTDAGSEFIYNFQPVVYSLEDHSKYLSIVRGEGLASCVRLTLASENSTFSVLYKKGETVRCVTDTTLKQQMGAGSHDQMDLELDPADVERGMEILHPRAGNLEVCRVMGKAKGVTEADIISRLGKLMQYLSSTEVKVQTLWPILDRLDEEHGAVIFCQYLDTVAGLVELIQERYPGRPVDSIVGGEPDIQEKIEIMGISGILVVSRVAAQSIDFYYDTLIIYEPITNPGGLEQLLGRITRLNATFREANFYFIVGNLTIEHYFYERLLYLVSKNMYSPDMHMEHLPIARLDFSKPGTSLRVLKDVLLWRKAYADD